MEVKPSFWLWLVALIVVGIFINVLAARYNFSVKIEPKTDVKAIVQPATKASSSEANLDRQIRLIKKESGNVINKVDINYEGTELTADFTESFSIMGRRAQNKLIASMGKKLVDAYRSAGYKGCKKVVFYDQFSSKKYTFIEK